MSYIKLKRKRKGRKLKKNHSVRNIKNLVSALRGEYFELKKIVSPHFGCIEIGWANNKSVELQNKWNSSSCA